MSEDALIREWKTSDSGAVGSVHETVEVALARDRSERDRERKVQAVWIGGAAILWPILLWCAAHGVTPAVRGGYALMAAGVAVMLFAEFVYSSWSRKARPGADDSLTQLGTTIGLLKLQAALLRSAAAWCAPVFLGAGLIGWWIFAQRSHAAAFVFWGFVAAAWLLSAIYCRQKGRELDARRSRLEGVLNDLKS